MYVQTLSPQPYAKPETGVCSKASRVLADLDALVPSRLCETWQHHPPWDSASAAAAETASRGPACVPLYERAASRYVYDEL